MPNANHKKAWVVTPNQDYTATGVLQVGQILTDYIDPNSAVLAEGTVPIPEKTLRDQSTHRGVDYTSAESCQSGFRAWLEATAGIPTGGTLTADSQKAKWERYSGHTISVFLFQPSVAYARQALAHGDGPAQIKVPWYKTHARVWLVTGLRVLGKGTKVNEGFIKRVSATAAVEGDGTAANAPVLGGAGVGFANEVTQGHVIEDSDPFVYSYRLHEIIVKRKLDVSRLRAFTHGRVSSADQGNDDDSEDSNDEPQFVGYEVMNMDNEAFAGDEDDANPLLVE